MVFILTMASIFILHRISSLPKKILPYRPSCHKFSTSCDSIVPFNVGWVLQFDGGSRGNPGLGGAGAVIYKSDENKQLTEMWSGHFFLGKEGVTNNEAEYTALIEGLKQSAAMHIDAVLIQGDSQLIVRQILGAYKVRKATLIPLHATALRCLAKIPNYHLMYIPREQNARADALSNVAMDTRKSSTHCDHFAELEALLSQAKDNFPPLETIQVKKPRKKRTPKAAVTAEAGGETQESVLNVEAAAVVERSVKRRGKKEVSIYLGSF